ncbi:predicted protein [Sclerotinia sclerotiorum 1980 UF-70]|uniref:Uncharacterized protein n=1 Tax=Sclerotinia sclerotiorum (strain ATCC 18683 / 1980 / Ss-1) TaxID=665079 RepID=A7F5K6_SCLS1|nr:predicted protein [Sclerotinia sclerotiorum 1980 UF-70]EDN98027.1 predicted protein [Sclerotinia sclerotiorum 1980 UF-70]
MMILQNNKRVIHQPTDLSTYQPTNLSTYQPTNLSTSPRFR